MVDNLAFTLGVGREDLNIVSHYSVHDRPEYLTNKCRLQLLKGSSPDPSSSTCATELRRIVASPMIVYGVTPVVDYEAHGLTSAGNTSALYPVNP